MFGSNQYFDFEDLEIKGDLEQVKVKCPNCNRRKSLQFFLENTCECDYNLLFNVEMEEVDDENNGGLNF